MATLSVLKFDDPGGADRVLIALEGMQEREMITLEAFLPFCTARRSPPLLLRVGYIAWCVLKRHRSAPLGASHQGWLGSGPMFS